MRKINKKPCETKRQMLYGPLSRKIYAILATVSRFKLVSKNNAFLTEKKNFVKKSVSDLRKVNFQSLIETDPMNRRANNIY